MAEPREGLRKSSTSPHTPPDQPPHPERSTTPQDKPIESPLGHRAARDIIQGSIPPVIRSGYAKNPSLTLTVEGRALLVDVDERLHAITEPLIRCVTRFVTRDDVAWNPLILDLAAFFRVFHGPRDDISLEVINRRLRERNRHHVRLTREVYALIRALRISEFGAESGILESTPDKTAFRICRRTQVPVRTVPDTEHDCTLPC